MLDGKSKPSGHSFQRVFHHRETTISQQPAYLDTLCRRDSNKTGQVLAQAQDGRNTGSRVPRECKDPTLPE